MEFSISEVSEIISKYGFPTFAVVGLAFIINYVWKWVSVEVEPVLDESHTVLIGLIDRIRMLDNDLLRLNQKVNTVLHLKNSNEYIESAVSDRSSEKTKEDSAAASGSG
jgi:hypothetical protein